MEKHIQVLCEDCHEFRQGIKKDEPSFVWKEGDIKYTPFEAYCAKCHKDLSGTLVEKEA